MMSRGGGPVGGLLYRIGELFRVLIIADSSNSEVKCSE